MQILKKHKIILNGIEHRLLQDLVLHYYTNNIINILW